MDKLEEGYRIVDVKLVGSAISNILSKQDNIIEWINAHDKNERTDPSSMVLRPDLMSRGFKFASVLQRKPIGESFTHKEHMKAVEMALGQMPPDLQVTETCIETQVNAVAGNDEIEMHTVIYWKEPK